MNEELPLTIDSIENSVARVESSDGTTFEIPHNWLPPEAREGQVLKLSVSQSGEESHLHFTIDEAATTERKKRVRSKLDQLRQRGKK